MHNSMELLFVVALVSFHATVTGNVQWGSCDCSCVKRECEWPKTAEQCMACNAAVKYAESYFDGRCWVRIPGNPSQTDASAACAMNFKGCSGYSGKGKYYPQRALGWCIWK